MVRLYGKKKFNLPKVLVTSIYGHDDMLDYFSDFRTQDKMRSVHYYPKGALCWFETNQYGDPIGSVYFVRKIPDMKLINSPLSERGFKRLKAQQKKRKTIKDALTRENQDTGNLETTKPTLHKWKEGE